MSSSSKKNDGSPAAEHNAPKPHAGGGPARSGCAHHAPSRNAPGLQARGPHEGCAHVVITLISPAPTQVECSSLRRRTRQLITNAKSRLPRQQSVAHSWPKRRFDVRLNHAGRRRPQRERALQKGPFGMIRRWPSSRPTRRSSGIRPASSTATAVTVCLCTSTPITIIWLASKLPLGATGERTDLNRGESHAPIRSRSTVSVGGGDTTLDSQPSGDIRNRVTAAVRVCASYRTLALNENDIEFRIVSPELTTRDA